MPFLWMSVLSDLSVGCIILFSPIDFNGPNPWNLAIAAAFVYAVQHFVLEGIPFTMMQYGCGYQAALKSSFLAFLWSIITFFVQLIIHKQGNLTFESYIFDLLWNILLIAFYFALWIIPYHNLFRRSSIIFYAKFWLLFRIINIISDTLSVYGSNVQNGTIAGYCVFVFGNAFIFSVFKPYVVYYTLLADSIWW